MDTYCLAGRSALEFWFRESLPYGYSRGPMEPLAERLSSMGLSYVAPMDRLSATPPADGVVRGLLDGILNGFARPLQFLGTSDVRPRRTRAMSCHTWGRPLPYGSLVMVGEGLLVSSPEFAFFQLSKGMSPGSMVLLAHELCASYVRSSIDARGFRPCPLLSSAALLNAYMGNCDAPARSIERYRRPLAYVRDGAASPMEAVLSTRLAMPRNAGGYALGTFELNGQIEVKRSEPGQDSRVATYYGDILWRENSLIVEYDSEQFHTGARRIDEDARRRNELQANGYTVVTVTKQQMYDVDAFHRVGMQLTELLGLRFQERRVGYDWKKKREHLAEELLERRPAWSEVF